MTIMITGATGFVGRALMNAYLANGADVVALVRQMPSESDRDFNHPHLSVRQGDIVDLDSLKGKFQGIRQVIHAAGRLGAYDVSEAEYDQVHVDGTRNVILEAERARVEKILHVSACGVQGNTDDFPQTEEFPYAPSNAYEFSKAEAEQMVLNFADAGVPVVVARPDFLYGPGDLYVLGLFQAIARGLYFHINGGRATCVPTYIDDCVDGLMRALDEGQTGEVYNITGPRSVTFRQMTDRIADEMGVGRIKLSMPKPMATVIASTLEATVPLVGGTPPITQFGVSFYGNHHQFSYAKAMHSFNYFPQVDIDEGIARTVAWYRANQYL